ncbi:protoporphyrinogen oxidase-like [Ptychodera flava]|uniref:protoporphyrinogen oxidase-like n=1 Tax=Ptychodera flava TaxID=63121 RepID=UPI003969E767
MSASSVVVLGGGISGLASAYYLAKSSAARFQKIILLEASSRLGGWVNTTVNEDGGVFEHGPRSMRPAGVVGRNSLELISDLGLADSVVPVLRDHPGAKKRFIYANQQLHQLPSSLKSLLTRRPPFSKPLISHILKEPFIKEKILDDESVHDFIRKRLGQELADYVIDPLCIGVFAGDARQLSAKSCFPVIFNPARQHGSIVKGELFGKKDPVPKDSCALVQRARKERWPIWTLKQGLQGLTDTLAETLTTKYGVEIHKCAPCTSMEFTAENMVKISSEDKHFDADHVISTLPAKVLAAVLPDEHSSLAEILNQIDSVTVAVINLEFEGAVLPEEGFGYLVPSWERSKLLGVVYDSCTFPQHDRPGPGTTRITCMMGGHWFNDLFGEADGVSPEFLLNTALETLKDHIGIAATPLKSLVTIQKDCITQYRVGHSQVVDDVDDYLTAGQLPLMITGASYRGVSVNDCIFNSKKTVEKLLCR